ncbi:MAG: HNH nuclease family protein [Nitrospirae bacterium]|nr:HNH nuclease family protein [Nitrospirota bacterium]
MKDPRFGRDPRKTSKLSKPSKIINKSNAVKSASEIVKELKKIIPKSDYREQSLKINGLICAKCGKEFEPKERHLLTVHHKDGNHDYNPADGSNWENLCVYCHDDEHSRGLLGDILNDN